jgi:hypothetical protein
VTRGALVAMGLDALLYAAMAYTLCLSSREFELYNLSSGAWVVIGGWLGAWIFGPLLGARAPVRPWAFLFLPLIAAIQVLSPLFLRNALHGKRLLYLFVSLGVALILTAFGQVYLVNNSADIIPIQAQVPSYIATFACLLFIVLLVSITFAGKYWAKTVLNFRLGKQNKSLYWRLASLLLIELILLLALGASSYSVHKGLFGEVEYRTVIPILAVVLGKSDPIKASLVALLVVISGHVVESEVSYLAGYSVPISIAALIIAVLLWSWPWDSVVDVNKVGSVPSRPVKRPLTNDPTIVGMITLLVLIVVSSVLPGYSQEPLNRFLLVAVLSSAAWIAIRYLGVRSIAWHALAAICVYGILHLQSQPLYLILVFIVSVAAWVCYLFALRVLKSEASFVVDLSLVICLYNVVLKSTGISGAQNVLEFTLTHSVPAWPIVALQTFLIVGILWLVSISGRYSRPRGFVLGLANFRLGWQHGVPIGVLFALSSGMLILCCIAANVGYHVNAPITPNDLSLANGLIIFLFAYLMLYWEPGPIYVLIFVVYYMLGKFLAGYGLLFEGFLGTALVAVVLFLSLTREGRAEMRVKVDS